MSQNDFIMHGYIFVLATVLSGVLTYVVFRLSKRWAILDHPGERKIHEIPTPVLGGLAIVTTFYLLLTVHAILVYLSERYAIPYAPHLKLPFLRLEYFTIVGGVMAGGIIIFIVGIVDDLLALNPWIKLLGQIIAATVLVLSGIHIEMFIFSNVWLSAAITIFWVVLITNSMNLLDNMDGLSGGVAVIAAFSFFLSVQPDIDGQLVRFMLMIFAGAMCGFLYHNFNPATIFMGDSGALFSGYFLATVAVLGTYHLEGSPSRIAVAAPLFALSVPLFDTLSVMFIRWRSGQSIMLGDKRHFSHRLVDLGMSERQAVEFIYLVASIIGLGGALLAILNLWGTILVLVQSVGIFLLIVLLMNAGKNAERRARGEDKEKQ